MIPVFIPVVNRLDLAEKAVSSISCCEIYGPVIVNNTGEKLPYQFDRYSQLEPPVPLTFSQTQNWFINVSVQRKVPFYLFLHSDAEAEGDTVQRLVAMANAYTTQKRKWGAIFTNYDALAAFNVEAMIAVGGWDPMLSWYLSDCDLYRRIRLAGYPTIESNLPVKHTPSQTLNSDPIIRRSVDLEVPFRRAYYTAKWGGDNEHEIFLTPFNQ